METWRLSSLPSLIRWLVALLATFSMMMLSLDGTIALAAASKRSNPGTGSRSLSFEDRVEAQRAMEEVLWKHRIWPSDNPGAKPPLSAVLSEAEIRDRVTDYLKKSNALEKFWSRPISGAQLQAEMDRMAKNSRQTEVLREIFAALDDDPVLIAECFARPTLAGRLLNSWYSRDTRFHGRLRQEAEEVLARGNAADAGRRLGADYRETTWKAETSKTPGNASSDSGTVFLPAGEYESLRHRLGVKAGSRPGIGQFGVLQEEDELFFSVAFLGETENSIRTGVLVWPKAPFDSWWKDERASVGTEVSAAMEDLERHEPLSPGCTDDSWTSLGRFPDPRTGHAAIWTGSEMLIWGGNDPEVGLKNSLLRYSPATDSWSQGSSIGAPSPREGNPVVWTGSEMIVWGGKNGSTFYNDGARYNPGTNSWTATGIDANTASARASHTAVWTGSSMIVWGGLDPSRLNSGASYDPSTETWLPVSNGSGVPTPRSGHSAVWTGTVMVIWGGTVPGGSTTNTGSRYNPGTDAWNPTTLTGASLRTNHSAVWTGSEMIITLGDSGSGQTIRTSKYNPVSDAWTPETFAPYCAVDHTAVWTGVEMIVWGGGTVCSEPANGAPTDFGFRYNPITDVFTQTNRFSNVPIKRQRHSAVWTGSEMIVWGGSGLTPALSSGARYDPSTNLWVSTASSGTPVGRADNTAIWTGTEMVIWGGVLPYSLILTYPDSGARYVPSTDSWTPTNNAPGVVPIGRSLHTAVWTGTEMIVWGGRVGATGAIPINSGGRYSPTADSWAPTSTGTNVPTPRLAHAAVWTGTEMILWGGSGSAPGTGNSGGRYNPVADAWTPTGGGANLPAGRSGHSATWTGSQMFVWGGTESLSGGRYVPTTDSWLPVSTTGAKSADSRHTAVWTGSEVIIWGGGGSSASNTGARYDPIANSWTATSIAAGVPTARLGHSAVWTGGEMIVWGGISGGVRLNSGAKYDPANDSWTPTSGTSVPTARSFHSAVWAGTEVILWGGGSDGAATLESGGRYCRQCDPQFTHYRDKDNDDFGINGQAAITCNATPLPGFASAGNECDDVDATIYPGAPPICDAKNNDCSDPIWPALPPAEANADGDGFRVCQGDCDDVHSTVYPGAPQICDGLNNDCLDGTWPTMPANEADQDGDGFRICSPDCFDTNPQVWTGPAEVANLAAAPGTPTVLSWNSQSGSAGPETTYDLVGGMLTSPPGFLDISLASCLQSGGPNSFSDTRPNPGTGAGFWYLARGSNSCGVGTYGTGSFGLDRDLSIPPCP
jgi:N-acetylneuraminic acid mutarotase